MSDPLALFRALSDDDPGLGTAADVAEVKRAVAAMRRGRRLASPSTGRRLLAADWRRAAAVGVLTLGMLSLAAGGWRAAGRDAAPPALAGAVATPATASAAASSPPAAVRSEEWARRPVFEGIDSPRSASVYELAGENLDVVMVVDETLNI